MSTKLAFLYMMYFISLVKCRIFLDFYFLYFIIKHKSGKIRYPLLMIIEHQPNRKIVEKKKRRKTKQNFTMGCKIKPLEL